MKNLIEICTHFNQWIIFIRTISGQKWLVYPISKWNETETEKEWKMSAMKPFEFWILIYPLNDCSDPINEAHASYSGQLWTLNKGSIDLILERISTNK